VHCLIGPLAAFEALAIDDYIRQNQIPTLSVAAAEDMTQRHPNPWFVRATSTSSQCAHPLGQYAAKELKYKKMITLADDIAYGQEMCGGFQRVFEDNGGQIIQKLFPPLTVPDYGSYVAQLNNDADAIFLGFAGSNGFRFLKQFVEYGLKDKMQVIGGMTALDEAVLRNMGDEALGIITTCWYSAELDAKPNQIFAPAFRKEFKYDPGFYAASTYVNGAVLEAAVKAVNGKVEDKAALMAALRATNVETVRGPVKFDDLGNVVGNVYLRKVTRKDGRLVNSVFKTYPDVSQFWTYSKQAFLANPVYSRDFPPAKHLER
jgi:branched-chain amino acid transport system substrate-binding protein